MQGPWAQLGKVLEDDDRLDDIICEVRPLSIRLFLCLLFARLQKGGRMTPGGDGIRLASCCGPRLFIAFLSRI
jgi:hypothetical protein